MPFLLGGGDFERISLIFNGLIHIDSNSLFHSAPTVPPPPATYYHIIDGPIKL